MERTSEEFYGRIAVVTGGTQGVGEAAARRLASRGLSGLVISGRHVARGQAVARELSASGCQTEFVPADLTPCFSSTACWNPDRVGVMGMSLGAIVTAQACATEDRIDACLMIDAPVPAAVAASGLRQQALWITRPPDDQRLERAASGGWPEQEIVAQAKTVADALAHSEHGQIAELHGLVHVDFTDLPAVQPVLGWFGQSGATGVVEAHRQINRLTIDFFARSIGRPQE